NENRVKSRNPCKQRGFSSPSTIPTQSYLVACSSHHTRHGLPVLLRIQFDGKFYLITPNQFVPILMSYHQLNLQRANRLYNHTSERHRVHLHYECLVTRRNTAKYHDLALLIVFLHVKSHPLHERYVIFPL